MQKGGRRKSVEHPEEPNPPRTTHKLLQVCFFSNFIPVIVYFCDGENLTTIGQVPKFVRIKQCRLKFCCKRCYEEILDKVRQSVTEVVEQVFSF